MQNIVQRDEELFIFLAGLKLLILGNSEKQTVLKLQKNKY